MKTRQLFYEDVYQREFDAKVLDCGEDSQGYYVVLDQTIFYPEGGGQPADTGVLQITGNRENQSVEIMVRDVQYVDGEIHHYVQTLPLAGDQVHGIIDWEHRFDLMQQHSGEHIVSGWIHKKYGLDNVGFHMGEDVITIDMNGVIDKEQMLEIEKEVNTYLWGNHHTNIFYPDEETRKSLPYRSKKELSGEVRLVEFPGGDLCACCGLHVAATGEIGLVKLLSVKHFRQGVRIEMVSGKRALQLLHLHMEANSQVATGLSVKPDGTPEAVSRLQDEIYSLKGQVFQLRQEHSAMRAEQCKGRGNVLVIEHGLDAADIQKETDKILDVCEGVCVVLSLEEGKYAVGQREGDVRELVKEMNRILDGKGGGRPSFAQGFLQADAVAIDTFFEEKGFTKIT